MHLNTSPSTSPTLSIGFASPTSMSPHRSAPSASSRASCSSPHGSACAYPSWPTQSPASSYISDAELFGLDDCDDDIMAATPSVPYLACAPSPPRQYALPVHAPQPQQVLAPLYAPPPRTERKTHRRKTRRTSSRAQPMTPISESPETPE
ncbi:MAG: hypothetical protein INR71_00065 [Terriglobus roseus]|nr:hypothetical protein [Terriglobus roseus]